MILLVFAIISQLRNYSSSLGTKSVYQPSRNETKSELGKSVELSLCGLTPAQSQMDLFLDTRSARN